MRSTLNKYRMSDAEMAQIRASFPLLTWKRSRDGGADAQADKGGLRIWIVPTPAYRDPREGWKADVLQADYDEIVGVEAVTLKGCLSRLSKLAKTEASKWAAIAGMGFRP